MGFVDNVETAARPYHSALREEQAERTKVRLARAARKRFVAGGWAGFFASTGLVAYFVRRRARPSQA